MGRVPTFLDSIPDEKLCNWSHGEHTIYEDRKLGYRLDHQGMNQDKTHRIYIQPIKAGKSSKRLSSKTIVARTHVHEPGVPQNIRDALKESSENKASLVVAKA